MKSLLIIGLLLIAASGAFAQITGTTIPNWPGLDTTFYPGVWVKLSITSRDFQTVRIAVAHDSGAGPLLVARQDDTSAVYRKSVYPGETVKFPPVNNAKWLYIRATAKVHGRVWIF